MLKSGIGQLIGAVLLVGLQTPVTLAVEQLPEPVPMPPLGDEFESPPVLPAPPTYPTPTTPTEITPPPAAPTVPTQLLSLEISLSRRQLRVLQGQQVLKTYPVAIGRTGWQTPVGNFRVQQLIPNPAWKHPFTGVVIPGGDAENPLGRHWVGFWTDGKNWVGLHGTPNPSSVGRAVSHGCVRMFNRDIAELFPKLQLGTPIRVKP